MSSASGHRFPRLDDVASDSRDPAATRQETCRHDLPSRDPNARSRAAATSTIFALLAYEREHGALPERLEELVPGELQRLPVRL
jgi:hypothetical protein